jgi:hypothetical protein
MPQNFEDPIMIKQYENMWTVSVREETIFATGREYDAKNLVKDLSNIEQEYGMDLKAMITPPKIVRPS